MKTIKYILALSVVAMSLGCKDLKREDYTQIYEDQFYQTETDLKLAVNALYSQYKSGYGYGCLFNPGMSGYQQFSEMTTDIAWCGWGGQWDELHFMQWANTGGTGEAWNSIFAAFGRYNNLSTQRNTILRIKKSPVTENIRKKYEAEARGLRGWMSLFLYDYFGTVPVASDEIIANPKDRVYIGRATQEEWDAMMEEDLRFAIENLPTTQPESGRLTKGAARMILMKYYMIRKDFVKAEALGREILAQEGAPYGLMTNYADVFKKENHGNKELILQIPTNNPNQPNILVAHIIPDNMPWTERSGTWGAYVMPWDFYDTFDSNDKRKEQICAEYVTARGTKGNSKYDPKYDGEKEVREAGKLALGAIPLKYGKDPDMSGDVCEVDIVIYRFSDVLLSVAELATRNTGSVSAESIGLVNRVRNRAGLGNLAAAQTASSEAFLDAILIERGHELWFEGLRRQDLIRYNKYIEYANNRVKRANAGQYPGLKPSTFNAVPDTYTKFWIAPYYIRESQDKIEQNPGYVK